MRIRLTSMFCAVLIGAPLAACEARPTEGAAPAAAATSVQAEGAEAFVRDLYASYTDDYGVQSGRTDTVWSERTKALWDENFEAAQGMGYLGFNPICACQDWLKLQVTSLVVTSTGSDSADAAVVFVNGEPPETVRQTLKLVREDGQWTVDDIAWGSGHILAGEPNMVEGLIASTAEIKAMPAEDR
ncbi:DUF3828 domain-containing protein [Brevundimonas sp. AJA228-03]|uniref:DUF3828 domain-containing protein n=1 Tax=Brevundimonas sp. AJA228-03 TaxID=2752515 RepID=UPI001AE06C4F|nr:DUF3828 domain-containing protein [Brevundimonas sp. AJA228-03]QTN18718.1 DUF3828 domain-containing protein [Brevundimonas sp. AJA228-03]